MATLVNDRPKVTWDLTALDSEGIDIPQFLGLSDDDFDVLSKSCADLFNTKVEESKQLNEEMVDIVEQKYSVPDKGRINIMYPLHDVILTPYQRAYFAQKILVQSNNFGARLILIELVRSGKVSINDKESVGTEHSIIWLAEANEEVPDEVLLSYVSILAPIKRLEEAFHIVEQLKNNSGFGNNSE